MVKEKGISTIGVALIFVGVIIGAGFASGREIWQFFGVFGDKGIIGLVIVAVLFVSIAVATVIISSELKTKDIGEIVVPKSIEKVQGIIGWTVSIFVYSVLITMSAAAGSLLYQLFGLPRYMGGAGLIILVILTLLGGFSRMSKVFSKTMPVLVSVIIIAGVTIMVNAGFEVDLKSGGEPTELSPNWLISGFTYASYNILAAIPILGSVAVKAENKKKAMIGASVGGTLLILLACVIYFALSTNPELADNSDLPMLSLISDSKYILSLIYSIILFFAIYGSATGNYYGFISRIKEDKYTKYRIVGFAVLAFVLGLIGFKEIVAYMLPIQGFVGFGIIILLFINLIYVLLNKRKKIK